MLVCAYGSGIKRSNIHSLSETAPEQLNLTPKRRAKNRAADEMSALLCSDREVCSIPNLLLDTSVVRQATCQQVSVAKMR